MLSKKNNHVDQAFLYWRQSQPLEAGRLLFERVPPEDRARWAARILQLVVQRTGIKPPAIAKILLIAGNPNDWGRAHDAFSHAREFTLQLENAGDESAGQKLLLRLSLLAELVAKVIYNASHPVDEFDKDSGWWIAVLLKEILDSVNDEQFSQTMWSALSSEQDAKPSTR
jgi:hypothetical protein